MSAQNVLVTCFAPQSFQSTANWGQVQSALRSQLPLRNIHWKSASRPSIRTIQELDVALVPLDSIRGENTSQIPVTLLEKPLLNIYFVTCEVCTFTLPRPKMWADIFNRILKHTVAPSRNRSKNGTLQCRKGRIKNGWFCRSYGQTLEQLLEVSLRWRVLSWTG